MRRSTKALILIAAVILLGGCSFSSHHARYDVGPGYDDCAVVYGPPPPVVVHRSVRVPPRHHPYRHPGRGPHRRPHHRDRH
jgi:uncharacterized lipoprotein